MTIDACRCRPRTTSAASPDIERCRASGIRRLLWGATLALVSAAEPGPCQAAIPEPDVIWYGTVQSRSAGQTIRLTTGTLTWRIEPLGGGEPWTLSIALTNLHDQFSYAIRLPCTSPEPGQPVVAAAGALSLGAPPVAYRRATVTLDGSPLSLVSAPAQMALGLVDRGQVERIDLVLGTVVVDTDVDGLGDDWERQFFGGLNARPGDDPDQDGVANLREFRAGTHPLDPRSRFEILEVEPVGNRFRIRWSSQPDRTYRIRRSATLPVLGGEYPVLQGGIRATPPLNEFLDPGGPGLERAFYLLEVEVQP